MKLRGSTLFMKSVPNTQKINWLIMMGLGKLSGRQDRRLTVGIAPQNDDFVSFRKCVERQMCSEAA